MILTYRYRLLPTRRQHVLLEQILESQRILYNAALEERIGAYSKAGVVRNYMDQTKALTVWRQEDEEARMLPVGLQRATLKRLDDAFNAFFRRLKNGEKPGFPRFHGPAHFQSFGFREWMGITLRGARIRFKGMQGPLRVHMHRPLPAESTVKNCILHREERKWSVSFAVELGVAPPRQGSRCVGVDLGIATFAALSDGGFIPSIRAEQQSARVLRVGQRRLARRQRGSSGYKAARTALNREHANIRGRRREFLHQAAARLVRDYDTIVIESLRVGALADSTLAREVRDASWGDFIETLRYKAERAGVRVIAVNAHDTSQLCSACGVRVQKPLSWRIHVCTACGAVIDRDLNAARNILIRAGVGPGLPNVAGLCGPRAGEKLIQAPG